MILRFEDFELDDDAFELRKRRRPVVMQPKVLDVLLYLAKNRDRVVTRSELFESVWGGVAVGDASLGRAVREARRALGDDGDGQRFIKTIHARGYRFVAPPHTNETPKADTRSSPPIVAEAAPAAGTPPDDFVGRSAAIATLGAALDAAVAGAGSVTLLTGEPGIGKTRLVERFADLCTARGARVLTGRSHDGEGLPPFWPWVQPLREALGNLEIEELGDALRGPLTSVAKIVPELEARFPSRPSDAPPDTPEARLRIFDGVARLLTHISRAKTTLLVLDDLQWADASSLLLLEYVAREIRRSRVLIVAAYREQALASNEALERAVGSLLRESPRSLKLEGFSDVELTRFLEIRLGTTPSVATTRALAHKTGGNPLFLSQILHLIEAAGGIDRLDLERLQIPSGMRDAIARHVDMLSDEGKRLLEVAAVAGQSFALPIVAAAGKLDATELVDPLAEALEAGVVQRSAERTGGYEFVHALIRQALYERLGARERAELHAEVGDALKAQYGAHSELCADELAYHYLRAPLPARLDDAISYASIAAERAFQKAAFGEAAELYRAAVEAQAHGERNLANERQLLLRLGAALGRDGRLPEASHAFRAAAAIPRNEPSARVTAPALDAALLRNSFHVVVERCPNLAERFYEILFSRYPESKSLFRREPQRQQKMFADALTAIVDHLEDPPWLRQTLLRLGARHHTYGVTDEMYAWVGTSLLATLAEAAAEVWTPRVQSAWSDAYVAISATMIEGARSAERDESPKSSQTIAGSR